MTLNGCKKKVNIDGVIHFSTSDINRVLKRTNFNHKLSSHSPPIVYRGFDNALLIDGGVMSRTIYRITKSGEISEFKKEIGERIYFIKNNNSYIKYNSIKGSIAINDATIIIEENENIPIMDVNGLLLARRFHTGSEKTFPSLFSIVNIATEKIVHQGAGRLQFMRSGTNYSEVIIFDSNEYNYQYKKYKVNKEEPWQQIEKITIPMPEFTRGNICRLVDVDQSGNRFLFIEYTLLGKGKNTGKLWIYSGKLEKFIFKQRTGHNSSYAFFDYGVFNFCSEKIKGEGSARAL